MKELLIFRHAKAESGAQSGRDFDRSLSQKGRSDALRQAEWLKEIGLQPDVVLSSPAARAYETATIVCEHLAVDPRRIKPVDPIYNAGVSDLLSALERNPGSTVMLFGHNPSLADLADFFLRRSVPVTTACIVHLQFDPPLTHPAQAGCAHLLAVRDKDTGVDRG